MVTIALNGVTKDFAKKRVLDDVSLRVENGEFIAVLGPSGCGKTTMLRLIAGFEQMKAGTIRFDNDIIASPERSLPPEKRNVGIVFQNYALWPHMTVEQNVGYALKIAGVSSDERRRRSLEALATVAMENFADRLPADLSGGQRQRVALARCLAANPTVMLLDEPLANLDVHLRASMESEFADFHRRTRATMIYITHDQSEAMALADRIAVMDGGRVMQVGRPHELYSQPQNEMVARFIGNGFVLPVTNIQRGARDGTVDVDVFGHRSVVRARKDQSMVARASLGLHPGDLKLAGTANDGFAAQVERTTYRGGHMQVHFRPQQAPHLTLSLHASHDRPVAAGDTISVCVGDGWVIPEAA
ncbi:ABC transporter ATP-binding protein [Aureimonas fodinaquatilis]|uniref:ABC transporter ATP-binding protein n=1 Tax=Aureimonas fodinaquatilis TaxID=2565783 RepID=A0A5B0DYR5_9HYPH|nr:ABC transporter ATP-binding protein [Aureimonas fodinaquatilis]KAA0971934.1 ABC transporter ATP-binding protein [Aureimonas fodinaquatilis]